MTTTCTAENSPHSSSREKYQDKNCQETFRKHGKRKKWKYTGTEKPSTSTSAKEHVELNSNVKQGAGKKTFDLPGYYYDEEKKKYFKILPRSGGLNDLTKEKIDIKNAEDRRQNDLLNISRVSPAPDYYNNLHLIFKRNIGSLTSKCVEKNIIVNTIRRFQPSESFKIFSSPSGLGERLEHMLHMQLLGSSHDELLCLWSLENVASQRIQILKLEKSNNAGEFKINNSGGSIVQHWNKVTGVCLAPYCDRVSSTRILYTTVSFIGDSYSLAKIRNLTSSDDGNDSSGCNEFNLGKKATWCCSWNPNARQFSVGIEKSSLLIDIETRRMWEFSTHNSDPLCQIFSEKEKQLLYCGTRRGEILTHDLRSSSSWPVTCLKQKSCISSLNLLSNEFNIVASDFTGQVNMWDLRMKKVVFQYSGLVNQYTKIPIHVDENESILYGAGQDCYMNLWDLKLGKRLKCLPSPCPASRQTIPCLQFSTHLADIPGKIGLLVGVEDKLHLYTQFPPSSS